MPPENHDLVEMLRSELRTGFALVTAAIGETNSRLDHLSIKVDHLSINLEHLSIKLDGMAEKIDGICSGL